MQCKDLNKTIEMIPPDSAMQENLDRQGPHSKPEPGTQSNWFLEN